ncbi:condensation domain-containing protein, partial [Pseudomonas sp. LS_1]|uniref:condensation domain-containing protein n=2 Tax=Pseudomonas TaxID=286 RepID=UPI0035C239ED
MQSKALSDLIERFIKLPTAQRKTLYQQMLGKGINVARLPIPVTRQAFAQVPLSFAQERQWFLWELEPTSTAYNLPTALRLRGALDTQALQTAFDALVARHESLRTRFVESDGVRHQVIDALATLHIEQLALPAGEGALEARLQAYVNAQVARPFDLLGEPLLRVQLVALGAHDHALLLVQHHIVSDAWSMQVMVEELVGLYHAASTGQPAALAELPIQYADYAVWQRHWMEAGERERQLEYWTQQLGSGQTVLELPTDRPRPPTQSGRGARLDLTLDAELAERLKQLAKVQNVTLFMLLLASFQTLLHRYSGQDDIRVGVPIANRNRVETERLIGFFVNTQVLKAEFAAQQSFVALLEQVKAASLGAQEHQELPFEQLVEALQPERSLSMHPLFQVMFNHLDAQPSRGAAAPGATLQVEGLTWETHSAQFDLTLNTSETQTGLVATLTYAQDLFEHGSIERMGRHWINLLHGIVANPQAKVAELPLLDAGERALIVEQWNDTTVVDYPLDTPVHHLIEQH